MPQKKRLDLFVRLAAWTSVLLLAAASCAPAVVVDLSGGWSGTITWTSGPMTSLESPFSLDLVDDGEALSGSAEFPSGYLRTFTLLITRAEVHADTIVLEASGQNDAVSPAVPVRFAFDGAVSATTMSGVGTQFVNGTSYTFAWEATLTEPVPVES